MKIIGCKPQNKEFNCLNNSLNANEPSQNYRQFYHFPIFLYIIGFILLYFKMAVMALVPETKMVDVCKLISLGNLLAKKTM